MSITFTEFIDSAKLLLKNGKNEIDYRNATSRAYYSAYHESKRISQYSNGINISNCGAHERLIQKLQRHLGANPTDDDIRQIGILLNMCKKQRTNADYFLNTKYNKSDTQQTILLVEQILSLSNQFP
ncbi:hypothetical protein [Legionella bozemanae]|uniref:hypothetical protein n=1 Tax=Legionella bozemanae TaxID=447 RepID=UPI001041717D|nr:hypothetical protein [Legionella bozemanae]